MGGAIDNAYDSTTMDLLSSAGFAHLDFFGAGFVPN